MLRLAVGSGTVGVLARLGSVEAFTRCGKPGKKCKFKNGTERRCCPGSRCKRRRCVCPEGSERCGKRCCAVGQTCRKIEDVRWNPGFQGYECVTPPPSVESA